MKHLSFFFVFFTLYNLQACSLNTKFDDDEYRPVGASTPLNSETHTVSETKKVTIVKTTDSDIETGSTRYIQPNSTSAQNSIQKKKPVTYKATPNTIHKSGQINKTSTDNQQSSSQNSDIITQTINNVFNSRYGDSELIITISKTVKIHCDVSSDNPKDKQSSDYSKMSVCEYQFPEHCGAHQFSLISNNKKQHLMFHDRSYQRNVIDAISGTKESKPGLWDKNDYVSSELLTVKQLINNKSNDNGSLGWIISVSDNEKSQLGRSYSVAIKEVSKCF